MVKRGTSARYIDVSEAFVRASIHSSADPVVNVNIIPKHDDTTVTQSQATTLLSRGINSPMPFSEEVKGNTNTVDVSIAEILEWSKNIK